MTIEEARMRPAVSEPNRWTAEARRTEFNADGCDWEVALFDGGVLHASQRMLREVEARSLAEQINGAPTVEDLPEGVHQAPDGTLIAHGTVVRSSLPDAWQRRVLQVEGIGGVRPWHDGPHGGARATWYEVRPIPEPETERVPWQQSIGRILPDGREIAGAWMGRCGPEVGVAYPAGTTSHEAPHPDADGRVEVLKETER